MITNELRKAAKEINEIVNNIVPNDYVLKIPLKFRKFLKEIEDQEYDFQIDINKDISEQNLSEKAKDIIAVIYRNYWCSEEERIEFDKTLADQENINKIIDKIIAKIDKLDKGTEIAMSELWKDEIKRYKLEFEDLFDMNEKILDICEEKNIKLNFDKYADAYVGLPYDVPFIKV